jgi:hypothetical protein
VPLTAAARRLYEQGHERGLGRLDDSALIEVLRQDQPQDRRPHRPQDRPERT